MATAPAYDNSVRIGYARVADTFYAALITGENTIDARGAVRALHHAVRAIRDKLPGTDALLVGRLPSRRCLSWHVSSERITVRRRREGSVDADGPL